MNIPWDLVFDLLYKWLDSCGDTEEARVAAIRRRPFAVRVRVTQALRKAGLAGDELREARREVIDEIQSATDDELRAFAVGGPQAVLDLDK
ncbi:hypothetical protein [Planctomycetes bacterium TBK1r]|uniref:Uncharacterized protein n=1 Tax=Stieleria magnilauensis TaxID=2527963 RepID=A0ABX5XZS2_9BACT|nr:hypothetical protein TBK1r_59660 [Planctomycetes bacterium TBK1r]QDV87017.1 hypothetical protein TBK1r_60440 [Planctomycetes bacterium TBK1r]